MNEPLVSVCIPTYNRLGYLPKTLQSVFDQDFPAEKYEVVVLDDGSSDGTREWFEAQSLPVRYFYQQNAGLAAARNTLISLARGKYISFLDSDDMLTKNALNLLVNAVEGRDDVCAYGGYIRIDENGNELPTKFKKRPSGKIVQALFENVIVHSCGSLFPRKVFIEKGGFDQGLRNCPDYIKYLELSVDYKFVGLDKPTFFRRRHSSNMSSEKCHSILDELNNLKKFYKDIYSSKIIDEKLASKRLAHEAYRVAKFGAIEGYGKDFVFKYYRESLSYEFKLKTFLKIFLEIFK